MSPDSNASYSGMMDSFFRSLGPPFWSFSQLIYCECLFLYEVSMAVS